MSDIIWHNLKTYWVSNLKELQDSVRTNCLAIRERLIAAEVTGRSSFLERGCVPFRISPAPFPLDPATAEFLSKLGPALYEFYQALNALYRYSLRNRDLAWVNHYLSVGKPERVRDYGRMNRFKHDLPLVIRPDIIPTDTGFVITELDSVPGGIGLTAALAEGYSALGYEIVGGATGIIHYFGKALKGLVEKEDPVVAIVVSDESEDYRPEMNYVARQLTVEGLRAHQVHPRDLRFDETGLYVNNQRIDILYRFFELFDLPNIPKIDLILYAIRKEMLKATPPLKSYLEEKMMMGLFHNPRLKSFWRNNLSKAHFTLLAEVFPKTWILDPTALPPYGVIPGLTINGKIVGQWTELKEASRRQRDFVIKPSGFSELAWGSRGVVVGNDVNNEEWAAAIDNALASFATTPHILQEFHKGRQFSTTYYDFDHQQEQEMQARARLCPYYFVEDNQVQLAGVLVTLCPSDKKIIHGMTDAIMTVAAVPSTGEDRRS